jgi:hypothetical protein
VLLRAHCLRAAARAALTSIEELVIAEMRLASDLMRWVWRGQRCCVVSSWIVINLLACKCTASERDATGALRSSLARAALGKSTKARPRAGFAPLRLITSYSTVVYMYHLLYTAHEANNNPSSATTHHFTTCSTHAAVLYTSASASAYIASSSLLQ